MMAAWISALLGSIPHPAPLVAGGIGLVTGALLGLVHFGGLWWNTQLYVSGGAIKAFVIQLLRFGILLIGLFILAKMSAVALLSGALGLLLTRRLLIRKLGKPA